ncbi:MULTISPECIES: SMI1/KNR4 family protein [unclassified Bacillus (in: firmicutes)]|uniref:SMI1/KNR4 family protein n=1 Tax=unclassified Bacillus (in: firmicutes) TaxID=185979 RepID=UPI000A7A859C|nr:MULTISPECIES: SMI1/KNR4 family protein [unclassified Bacillus (in: firmicutes)]
MTEEEFRAAEKSLRASFPKAYKRLLHKKNPAEIGEWIFFLYVNKAAYRKLGMM